MSYDPDPEVRGSLPCGGCRLAWSDAVEYAKQHDLPNPNSEHGMNTQQRIWEMAFRHCGHPMTWKLASIPPAPDVPDAWPLCSCESGKLVTTWCAPTPNGTPEMFASTCCGQLEFNGDHPKRVSAGLPTLSPAWRDALLLMFGGYKAIHAINRGQTPLPAWPYQADEPALF